MTPIENDLIYAVSFIISSEDDPTKHGGIRGNSRTEFAGFYKNREDAEKHKEELKKQFDQINTIESLFGVIQTVCGSSNISSNKYEVIIATFPLKSSFNENCL